MQKEMPEEIDCGFEEIEKQGEVSLTPNEIEKVDQVFASFDKDNNGYIDANELKSVLEVLGHHVTESDVVRFRAEYVPEGETHISNHRTKF